MYKIIKNYLCKPPGCIIKTLQVMKITVILLIATFMQVSATGFAQRITLNKNNISLNQVFAEIRKQTGFDVLWESDQLKGSATIDAKFNNTPLEEVMNKCLDGKPLVFTIQDKTVVIKEKEPSFPDNLVARFTAIDVRGRVVDEQGNPLPNASIQVKGNAKVYNSNEKGEFVLANVPDDGVLVIRYVGYKQLEISLKDAVMPLEIKLNVATGELEEVKVVYNTGYQELNKERATGSFVQIDNELLNRRVGSNILQRIIGVTSGVDYIPRNEGNTVRSSFLIRGISTINGNNNPLIVVDNFPYEGDINNINPNDIASITLLKDAAAASIWGVRAGNGVIVINTKGGKYNQKMSVQVNSNLTIGEKPDIFRIPTLSSNEMIEIEQDLYQQGFYTSVTTSAAARTSRPAVSKVVDLLARVTEGSMSAATANQQIEALKNIDTKDDIYKYLLQNSSRQQYALNVSGGSAINRFYGSIGYDEGLSNNVGDADNRMTIRLENSYKLFNKLEANGFINYVNSQIVSNGLNYQAFLPTGNKSSPYSKFVDEVGNALAIPYGTGYRQAYIDTAKIPALLDWHYKPIDEQRNADNTRKSFDVRLGAGIKYQIFENLYVDVKYQFQRGTLKERAFFNQNTYLTRNRINTFMAGTTSLPTYPVPLGAMLEQGNSLSTSWNIRGQLNFSKKWEKHELNALTGYEVREVQNDADRYRRYGFDEYTNVSQPINNLILYPIRPGTGTRVIDKLDVLSGSINRYRSIYGNFSYAYFGKYILNASARIDGSNFYGVDANLRRIPLWSAGLGWVISKEDFYNSRILPSLKLRSTIGYSGNTNNTAAAYATIRYNSINPNTNAVNATIVNPPNPQLRWESVRMVNLGIDFSSFDNIISGSVEFYLKKGFDLISPIAIYPSSGVTSYTGNSANLKARGIDVTLNSAIFNKPGFKWISSLIFSSTTDEVTKYSVEPKTVSEYLGGVIPVIGKPLNKIYSYRSALLDPNNGNPRFYLSDTIANASLRGNAKPSDLVYGGRSLPGIFGSVINTVQMSSFLLSFNLSYKFNYYFRRSSVSYNSLFNFWGGHSDYLNRWQNPGDELITNVPALPKGSSYQNEEIYLQSDKLIEKGDHIRLQDIRLSYNLSDKITKRLHVNALSFYVYLNNLGIIWRANKHQIDPDYSSFGNTTPTRTYSFGLNLNL
jgi:TonB-linked SusC/RagA family outer membrane protein